MKKILFLFMIVLLCLSCDALYAQVLKTGTRVITRDVIEVTGNIPNWISSLGMIVLDALSPLAYSTAELLAKLVRNLIYIFFLFYIAGIVIRVILNQEDYKFLRKSFWKRLFFVLISLILLNTNQKFLFEITVDPILNLASTYTTGFMVNVDSNYEKCVENYTKEANPEADEAISAETKAKIVCPVNISAKQIDVLMRLGTWMTVTSAGEFIGSFFANMIPYVGRIVSKALEYMSYVVFSVGFFFITKGFSLGLEMLWMMISVILQICLSIMLFPLAIFSYALENEESGFLKFASGWRANIVNMFKNGVLGFLFWSVAIGILGIFLQYVLGEMVIDIPTGMSAGDNMLQAKDLMNPDSVFYDDNGEIKGTVIAGLIAGFHNPANWINWLKMIFGLQLGFYMFTILKKEAEGLLKEASFTNNVKNYINAQVTSVENTQKAQAKSIMAKIYKKK